MGAQGSPEPEPWKSVEKVPELVLEQLIELNELPLLVAI
jgi:hypothetical protein